MTADFTVSNHGTICLVRPQTNEAMAFVNEKVQLEGWQWFGGAFSVDPRYLENLIEGIIEDGLTVE